MLILLPGSKHELPVNISDYWADQWGIGVKGWVSSAEAAPPDDLELICDQVVVPITSWYRRDDIAEKAPKAFHGNAWGFWCYIPSKSSPSLTIRRRGGRARKAETVSLIKHAPKTSDAPQASSGALFEEFRGEILRTPGRILEIGSRQVVPGGRSKRDLFPGCSYVGFDYYGDENTDVVGDAHELSKFFPGEFDAVFSLAVLEHLAMPWVVAAEISKVLKIGGLTFHSTHFAFPLHERPWDFWRYTDQALRILFSPPLGFEIVGCAFDTPARMHPDVQRDDIMHLPFEPVWIGISVLARKIAPLDPARFIWAATVAECLGGDSHYPPSVQKGPTPSEPPGDNV
jgi:hypothetical protein